MFDLKGKKALATGATGGIGGAIARALHRQGADIGISGRNTEKLEALKGVKRIFNGSLFHEAVISLPGPVDDILRTLKNQQIITGFGGDPAIDMVNQTICSRE